MKYFIYAILFSCGIVACQQSKPAEQDASQNNKPTLNRYTKKMVATLEDNPFEGIVTSEGKQEGLFPIEQTGVSTAPIVKAADDFLKSLPTEQQTKMRFDIDADEWRKWSNVDIGMYQRNGISLKEMTQEQRSLAFQLLAEALSAKGLQLTKDIMKTDQTLKELNDGSDRFDEEMYFLAIFGQPSMTEPWGWKINGHHLAINYFILGDQVVMTPTFMGGEPIITTTGKYAGNTIFQDEQNMGLKLMQSLPLDQQKQATLSTEKRGVNVEASAFTDNKTMDYEGVKVSILSADHKAALLNLAAQYINNMREGHAEVKMDDVRKHIDDTYFAWRGSTDEDAVFYYRIHSPVVLIEFDHQSPVGVKGERKPTRNHIHTMVRTPHGNDYGKDYLRQHLEEHHGHSH